MKRGKKKLDTRCSVIVMYNTIGALSMARESSEGGAPSDCTESLKGE
jgi:hypothetical protein